MLKTKMDETYDSQRLRDTNMASAGLLLHRQVQQSEHVCMHVMKLGVASKASSIDNYSYCKTIIFSLGIDRPPYQI